MAIDLNADMGSIIKGLLSKHSGSGSNFAKGGISLAPYKIAITIFALIIVISAAYIGLVYIPMKEENKKKMEELAKVTEMKKQLSVLDGQIVALKKNLDKSKEQYLESLAHFGNSEDLGSLYQTVSSLATKYGLVVLNVKEIPNTEKPAQKPAAAPAPEPKAAKADDKKAPAKKAAPAAPQKPVIDVKEIKVEVELKGRYGEYIKFKEDLALAEILLKINSESIMVKDEKTEQGSIYVKLNLSTYAIDKKPFQGIIAEEQHEKTN